MTRFYNSVLLVLVLFTLPVIAGAQQPGQYKQQVPALFGTSVSDGYQDLWEMPRPRIGERKGSPYFSDEWKPATVRIKGKYYSFKQARFDVLNNCLEFKLSPQDRILDGRHIETFLLGDSLAGPDRFIQAGYFSFEGTRLEGFLASIYERDSITLFRRYYTIVKPPDYNEALQMGNKFEELLVKNEFMISIGKNLFSVTRKSDLQRIFKEKEVNEFIRRRKISHKNQTDIEDLIEFYSSFKARNG